MARKTKTIQIDEEGRDRGKIFVITELPASQAERWATRALLSLARSGVDLPNNIASAGMAGIAVAGFQALAHINFEDLQPLMDEMFTCIRIQRDRKHPDMTFPLLEDDIEEITTRLNLRAEVFTLHTGFSMPGVQSNSSTLTTMPPGGTLPTTPIVRKPLRRSSPPGMRRS
jgi:hypothetical protein